MRLSLITPYRDRRRHLETQLAWWAQYPHRQTLEWIVVDLSPAPAPALQQQLDTQQVRYLPMPCPGPFHKTKALNLALAEAKGAWIAAFDVDLIPLGNTLMRHQQFAASSPRLLVTGYRLMMPTDTLDWPHLAPAIEQSTLGPEDQPSALRKYLLKGERFGVMPLLARDRLLEIGGWDEAFVGWGGEDQDLIERYLKPEQGLCRCHELLYLHLNHSPAAGWNEKTLTEKNRIHYYKNQQNRLKQRPT